MSVTIGTRLEGDQRNTATVTCMRRKLVTWENSNAIGFLRQSAGSAPSRARVPEEKKII